MNIIKHLTALGSGLLIFSSSLLAQTTTISTDPVGYVTVDIKGGGTNIISNAGLLQPISSVGVGAVTNEVVLNVSNVNYMENEFANTHYVQFTESGDWSAIESNTVNSISLETPVANGTDLAFVVRPLNTLDSLFGSDNSAGFTGGSSFVSSDKILIWGVDEQVFTGFFYYNNISGEWQNASNESGTFILYPDESIVVVAENDLKIVLSGSVQTNSASLFLGGGGRTSVVPNPYSVNLNIYQSGLESYLSGGSSFVSADKIFIWDPNVQAFSRFYYYNNVLDEWQNASNQKVTSDDFIPAGGAAIIVKGEDSNDTKWIANQPF